MNIFDKETYVFDLDGTLCSQETEYNLAKPLTERIKKVNELYDAGFRIIIYTARGMNRFNGDTEECYRNFYALTSKQLEKWNVKYHQLLLGKPAAIHYIDDKAINDKDFFEDK